MPRRILFFDTETRPEPDCPDPDRHFAYMIWSCFCTESTRKDRDYTERWKCWTDRKAFLTYIESLCVKKRCLYIIASNACFDLMVSGFFEYFTNRDWKLKFSYSAGRTFIVYIRKNKASIKALNIQNFFSSSIKSLGHSIGLEKLEVDFESSSFADIKTYCRRDTEILKQVFLQYITFLKDNDFGNFRMTQAGQALGAFQHRFMRHKIHIHNIDEVTALERKCYYGGRVECFYIGSFRHKDITSLDVNSMYPYVMEKYEYPVKLIQYLTDPAPGYLKEVLKDYAVCADVTLDTAVPLYPIHYNNRTVFPVGVFRTGLCSQGLKTALSSGHIQKVHSMAVYEKAPIFRDFVKGLMPLKEKYTRQDRPVWRMAVKILMNSLYGKFGQRYTTTVLNEDFPSKGFTRREFIDLDTGQRGIEQILFNKRQVYCGQEESRESFPAVCAHVTEYARFYLWELFEAVGRKHVLYCDTDSLKVKEKYVSRLSSYMHPSQLGKLDREGTARDFVLYGCKDYYFKGKKVLKGIRQKAKRIGECEYTQAFFPSLKTLLREGITDGFPIRTIKKSLDRTYRKGTVLPSGKVVPLQFQCSDGQYLPVP